MLYAFTILVSAFLLFQVEPVIARMIVPWFGGSAGVWTVCLLFFQTALLLGYLYAYGLFRYLPPRAQASVHAAMLALSLLFLPIIPGTRWQPSGPDEPSLRILALLTVTIGLPYLLLSTTGPLLQAWYARRYEGAVPYRLYALSNAGSVFALLSYPILIEPYLTTRNQELVWSFGYSGFVALCAAAAFSARKLGAKAAAESAEEAVRPRPAEYALWIALPACGSVLLLAVTNHLSQNVASIPFLWVLPLGLYLLTFILAFEGPRWYRRGPYLRIFAVALASMAYALSPDFENASIKMLIPLFAGGLFVCCMLCHAELARLRPDPRYLTSFYLMLALGGALGALFVAMIAPALFNGYFELHVGLAFCAILVLAVLFADSGAGLAANWKDVRLALGGFAVLGLVAWLGVQIRQTARGTRFMERNFYGSLRVQDAGDGINTAKIRILLHGTITHGEQFLEPDRRDTPTTYYGSNSGVAEAIRQQGTLGPVRVGIIGLGAGTLAAYGRPGDEYRFYEINPLVLEVARQQFTFLKDSKARVSVTLGDARLSLEREPAQAYSVLVLDAFSSDAIPVHLLTREAFQVYLRQLRPGGILAVHVSNKYVDLAPVVAQVARSAGKDSRVAHNGDDDQNGVFASSWVLVGDPEELETPSLAHATAPLEPRPGLRLWTDDYSNLFGILK